MMLSFSVVDLLEKDVFCTPTASEITFKLLEFKIQMQVNS